MSLPRYGDYKDSDIPWLGKIPEHWEVTKTKYVCSFSTGWTPPTGDTSSYEGENLWANISDLGAKTIIDTAKRISDAAALKSGIELSPEGSLLFSFKLSIGQVSFAGCDMFTNEAIATFRGSDELALPFAYYAFPLFLVQNASENIYGAKLLNQELIRGATYALPPIEEQTAIATFLDRETAKIDALIAEQEKLITLLAEKRQATISHAVTRGLNPNAPMKDSGVAWLGEMPEHWRLKRLKQVVRPGVSISYGIVQPGEPKEEGVPFIQTSNLSDASFNLDQLQRTTVEIASAYPRSRLTGGEVILGIRASIGAAYIVPEDLAGANLSRGIARIECGDEIVPSFLVQVLRSSATLSYWGLSKQGSTFNEVSIETVRELALAVPPLKEQEKIATFLEEELTKLTLLQTQSKYAIGLFKERRSALISAAVTGQIDVRGLVEAQPS